MIQTSHLSKQFGNTVAVQDLNLNVDKGEVFGLLGPNGAGKTTTVRLLTCLISPSGGSALVNGFRLDQDAMAIRRSVGIQTEVPGLYERLSVERNLLFFASLYGVENARRQVDRYTDLLGLSRHRMQPAGTISKGMRQRLTLARALLHEPQVLFLDEPTSALDPEAARLIRQSILELRDQGRTILICTHNLYEAERVCDRVGIMRTTMLSVDTPANLRARLFGRQVAIRVDKADDRMVRAIRSLPCVQSVSRSESGLLVSVDNPLHDNPQIVRLLVGLGAQVQFVEELQHSLEDIYVQLVNGGIGTNPGCIAGDDGFSSPSHGRGCGELP